MPTASVSSSSSSSLITGVGIGRSSNFMGGPAGVQVEIDSLLHKWPELRLVLVVEADAFDAPTPPLHVRNGCHHFSLLVDADQLGMFGPVGSGLVVQPADFLGDPVGEL